MAPSCGICKFAYWNRNPRRANTILAEPGNRSVSARLHEINKPSMSTRRPDRLLWQDANGMRWVQSYQFLSERIDDRSRIRHFSTLKPSEHLAFFSIFHRCRTDPRSGRAAMSSRSFGRLLVSLRSGVQRRCRRDNRRHGKTFKAPINNCDEIDLKRPSSPSVLYSLRRSRSFARCSTVEKMKSLLWAQRLHAGANLCLAIIGCSHSQNYGLLGHRLTNAVNIPRNSTNKKIDALHSPVFVQLGVVISIHPVAYQRRPGGLGLDRFRLLCHRRIPQTSAGKSSWRRNPRVIAFYYRSRGYTKESSPTKLAAGPVSKLSHRFLTQKLSVPFRKTKTNYDEFQSHARDLRLLVTGVSHRGLHLAL